MSKQKPMTEGQEFASELMFYLDTMYPDIMKQSRSFRMSLKNYTAQHYDMWQARKKKQSETVRNPRTPIEMMIDQACGVAHDPTKGARDE